MAEYNVYYDAKLIRRGKGYLFLVRSRLALLGKSRYVDLVYVKSQTSEALRAKGGVGLLLWYTRYDSIIASEVDHGMAKPQFTKSQADMLKHSHEWKIEAFVIRLRATAVSS